jgi:hypothetical protein
MGIMTNYGAPCYERERAAEGSEGKSFLTNTDTHTQKKNDKTNWL